MELDVPVSYPNFSFLFFISFLIYWKLRCKKPRLAAMLISVEFFFFLLLSFSLTSFIITHAQNTVPPEIDCFELAILSRFDDGQPQHKEDSKRAQIKK